MFVQSFDFASLYDHLTKPGGGVVGPLLNFRLDEGERRRATDRALRGEAEVVRELGAALEPGAALAAVLIDHVWSDALDDGFRLAHRQLGSGTGLKLQQRELVRRLRSLERPLRHREKFVVGE